MIAGSLLTLRIVVRAPTCTENMLPRQGAQESMEMLLGSW